MKKIILFMILAFGCTQEIIQPTMVEKKKDMNSQLTEIEQLMSNISLLTLMSTEISQEPFDDMYLSGFSNYLEYNVIDRDKKSLISQKKVSNYIISKIEQGTPYDKISINLIDEFIKGNLNHTDKIPQLGRNKL
jgi:hydroxymethylglutaryl-CoA reductase